MNVYRKEVSNKRRWLNLEKEIFDEEYDRCVTILGLFKIRFKSNLVNDVNEINKGKEIGYGRK